MSVVVVCPTIREESYKVFREAWDGLLEKHGATLITVWDGDKPAIAVNDSKCLYLSEFMGKDEDLIYNKNDGVRNAGFYFIAKNMPDVGYIITLDDDTLPINDSIQDHIDALNMRVPTTWISTTTEEYPRGFPYGIREESEVVLSHGVWMGVKDWDAPTQLVKGNPNTGFYKGAIPRGINYPMCGMNIAFKRKMLPYMYYAPMGHRVGLDRFADIWLGIESKKIIDENNWAVVTGYAKVLHNKASNVWTNLRKEASGLEMNEVENYGKGEYFKMYADKRKRWEELCLKLI